ncbi:MAG: hypothetical protein ABIN80_17820 [Dyadobacter sp.]|uniref:hypothetical protein n=1 Tax=Dyadobacter sp. TaxID=1914288 RepID=UPI003265469C
MATSHKLFVSILWTTLFAIIAIFWLSVYHFSYDFPFYDDFENIVQFVFNYIQADGFQKKLSLLFEQNFEHRVIFAKLLTLSQYLLIGSLNIKWLIMLGNLSLLGVLFLLYQYLSKKQLSLLAFFASGCLLFQVQHYEDTISWATCSLQHAPCLFFSLWSFHLALNRKNLYASGSLALLALFTSANGLSAIVIWLIIIYVTSPKRKEIILPSLILVTVTAVHLLTMTIHSGSLREHITSNIGTKLILLLSFAGQLLDSNVTGHILPSVVLGAIFLLPIGLVLMKLATRRFSDISQLQWFCVAGISTLLFVAFLIVFARGIDPDFHGYKMDRYKIYAAFFAILAIGFYDGYWAAFRLGWIVRTGVTVVAFLFCISTYYIYYGPIVQYKRAIEANQLNFLWSKTIYYPLIYNDRKTAEYLAFAQNNNLVNLTSNEFPVSQAAWELKKDSLPVQKLEDKSTISLFNSEWMPEAGSYDALYAVAIDSPSRQPRYLITIENTYQRAFKRFYTKFERPVSPGFHCTIYKPKMKKGSYDIHLVLSKNGRIVKSYELSKVAI